MQITLIPLAETLTSLIQMFLSILLTKVPMIIGKKIWDKRLTLLTNFVFPTSHNISLQEMEEKKRQKDGVDALLSLSKMFDISPIKRPASNTVEEEHISSYMDNITHVHGRLTFVFFFYGVFISLKEIAVIF